MGIINWENSKQNQDTDIHPTLKVTQLKTIKL